jgi:hypothetical protein
MRRIGILLPAAADHSEYQARVEVFLQALAQSGWANGRNVRIDTRWATTNHAELRRQSEELAALAPDVTEPMSPSLIGRLGSSTFRLSTTAVSMSLTGSRFSSESAPRPFHHGIRGRGGTIYWAALPSVERPVQADMRTHLIHRPARDIFPLLSGTQVSSYRM